MVIAKHGICPGLLIDVNFSQPTRHIESVYFLINHAVNQRGDVSLVEAPEELRCVHAAFENVGGQDTFRESNGYFFKKLPTFRKKMLKKIPDLYFVLCPIP